MAETMGLGACLITKDDGLPCGLQIGEGEPIGTVVIGTGPVVGHRNCADAFMTRRKKVVQIGKQQGPGGVVDPTTFTEGILGSTPLVKEVKTEEPLVVEEVPAPVEAPAVAPDGGWEPNDFPQLTALFIPYSSRVGLRPDPLISIQNDGSMLIELGNIRLAVPDREEWQKLVTMVSQLWVLHESKSESS